MAKTGFAYTALKKSSPKIYQAIQKEQIRQKEVLEMIASENYTSASVIETLGSVFTNKYSEGYPKRRYYQGNGVVNTTQAYLKSISAVDPVPDAKIAIFIVKWSNC